MDLSDFPFYILLIIVCELCYKMAQLDIVTGMYFLNEMRFEPDIVTILVNLLMVSERLFSLIVSAIADGYIGRYGTILCGTIIFAFGQFAMSLLSALPSHFFLHPSLDMAGILVMTFGDASILACVSTFGADQFPKTMLNAYFKIYYAIINFGSAISRAMLPILRVQNCFGKASCFPLAFGVPGLLMASSAALFFSGRNHYKRVPPNSILAQICALILEAYRNRRHAININSAEAQQQPITIEGAHWLDHAMEGHNCEEDDNCKRQFAEAEGNERCYKKALLDQTKRLLHLLVMLLPVPMFFALVDQASSVWLIQATKMNGNIFGNFTLLPDQMQTLNPIITIFLVILSFIFSVFIKISSISPLRNMFIGGILAVIGFLFYAFVQIKIEASPKYAVSILWQLPQIIVLTAAEVCFCPSGMEFFYKESGPSMKSIVQALWLLSGALGELIIVFITAFGGLIHPALGNPVHRALLFAILMTLDMIAFAFLSVLYYGDENAQTSNHDDTITSTIEAD